MGSICENRKDNYTNHDGEPISFLNIIISETTPKEYQDVVCNCFSEMDLEGFKSYVENTNTQGKLNDIASSNYMVIAKSAKVLKKFKFEIPKRFIIFEDFVNLLFIESVYAESLDANFISKYNKEEDKFEYAIQRLSGIAIDEEHVFHQLQLQQHRIKASILADDENKATNSTSHNISLNNGNCSKQTSIYYWAVYVNKVRFEFTYCLTQNLILQRDDRVEFRLEKLN